MPSRKYPRIELDQEAYDALQAESILQSKPARTIASEAILRSMSRETLDFIRHKTNRPQDQTIRPDDQQTIDMCATKRPNGQETVYEECVTLQHSESKSTKPKLANDQDALNKIKDLWASGEHNAAEIGRRIGYDRKTVWENINKMKKRGELQEDKPAGEEQPGELNNV